MKYCLFSFRRLISEETSDRYYFSNLYVQIFLSQIKSQDFNITKEILVLDLSWEAYYSQEICPFVLNGQITSVTGPLKFYFKIQTEC